MMAGRIRRLIALCSLALLAMTAHGAESADRMRVDLDLEYASVEGRSLRLDLYRPLAANEATTFPVVVWIHGGGWRSGTRKSGTARAAQWLVPAGIAVAGVEYRLSGEAKFPAQIHDCKAAVRWLRAHADQYDLAPERIGAWGSSAGAHLAALLGVTAGHAELEGDLGHADFPSHISAVVDWWGPMDLLELAELRRNTPHPTLMALFGFPPHEQPERVKLASPIHHVTPESPPFLIMHGLEDTVVPPSESIAMDRILREHGVESTLHLYEGVGHGIRGPDLSEWQIDRKVVEFFIQTLGTTH